MRAVLIVLVAALLLVAALVAGELFRSFEFSDRYSAYRGGAEGAKALYLTLEALRLPVMRLHEMPGAAGFRGALFLLLDKDASDGLPGEDSTALIRWSAEGNTLIVAHEGRLPLLAELGLSANWAAAASQEETLFHVGAGDDIEAFARVHPVSMRRPGAYRFDGGRAAVLLSGARGPAALVVPRGRGRVVLVSDPWVFSNVGLKESGNLELALFAASLGIAEGGRIGFDERHHGFAADRSVVGYLRRRGLAPALLQAVLAVAVAVLALSGRRSPIARVAESEGPGSGDFLAAMARIYSASGFAADAARDLAEDLRRSVARELPPRADGISFVAALALADRALARDVNAALERGRSGIGQGRDAQLVAYHNQVMNLERRVSERLGGKSRPGRRDR